MSATQTIPRRSSRPLGAAEQAEPQAEAPESNALGGAPQGPDLEELLEQARQDGMAEGLRKGADRGRREAVAELAERSKAHEQAPNEGVAGYLDEQNKYGGEGPQLVNRPDAPTDGKGLNSIQSASYYLLEAPAVKRESDGTVLRYQGKTWGVPFINGRAVVPHDLEVASAMPCPACGLKQHKGMGKELALKIHWDFGYQLTPTNELAKVLPMTFAATAPEPRTAATLGGLVYE